LLPARSTKSKRGKAAPDIYLLAAEKLGVEGGACLVIEDSLSGIAAAKAAKMRVAPIPDTRFVEHREYEREADHLLNNLSEIPALVSSGDASAVAGKARKQSVP
jgi:beta-phosphoglucomutase-like phosphatase (HAD superfamily)